jgi:exodeoxyribonuclease V alpha subunit
MNFTISKERLALLATKYKKTIPEQAPPEPEIQFSNISALREEELSYTTDKHGNRITYNSRQQEFISLAASGKNCVLIGAAGTGKTTCQKGATQALISSGKAGVIEGAHKYLQMGTPGIVICAFTRRAAANIAANLPPDLRKNCMTIHALLEYQPEYFDVEDPTTGEFKKSMRFLPARTADNPLSASIRTIIFEETSMLGTDLHQEVINACPHNPQLIYLGDIQQLPPVFGPAILGFKLLELPVVELTEVYRQALESPIISLAHRCLAGRGIPAAEFPTWNRDGLTIRPFKKKVEPEYATIGIGNLLCQMADQELYTPSSDIILIPFNKAFGTDELNKIMANHLARKRGAETHEIIAGFQKVYLSVGDKILVDKEDAIITKIETNPAYYGAKFKPASKTLDYWGHDPILADDRDISEDDMDFILSQVASQAGKEKEDRVNQASHFIHYLKNGSELPEKVQSAGDVNAILLGYVLTVHKAQGSEWNKVILIMHASHATMNSRELLYTAITRAKKELLILCEPDTLMKGIENARIKGTTLQEKAVFFQGKKDRMAAEKFS